jgi:hypothetical protein
VELCAQRKNNNRIDCAPTTAKKQELTEGGYTKKTLGSTRGGKWENKLTEATYIAHTRLCLPGKLVARLRAAQKININPNLEPHSSICKKNEVRDRIHCK